MKEVLEKIFEGFQESKSVLIATILTGVFFIYDLVSSIILKEYISIINTFTIFILWLFISYLMGQIRKYKEDVTFYRNITHKRRTSEITKKLNKKYIK